MFSGFGGSGKKKDDDKSTFVPTDGNGAATMTTAPTTVGQASSVHGFDPSALERAAKAARDLDGSKNSKEAIRMINNQEYTKQKEHEMDRARFQAMQQELAIRRVAEEEQSAARTLERKQQIDKAKLDYQDQLERKRSVEQINAQRHLNEEERKKNEESMRRLEELKRKTLEHEATLRQKTEMARVKAESEGRIEQERVNHDLILEKKRLEAKEYRETVLESIQLAGTTIGNGVYEFLNDKNQLTNLAGTLVVIAFGVYTAKTSTHVAGKYIEARLGKPNLVRETTKKSFLSVLRRPYTTIGQFLFRKANIDATLSDVVVESTLAQRLRRIALSTGNTKKNNAPFRHLLLHGPPGTGKTLFAKNLAHESGLDYAIMTGGDVAPLGTEAVTEIHKLFDWANTSRKGVLIFVDEADAFLRKRSTEKISEDMRNALNAFLYRTGEASRKFMLVYASNQPEQFDWAINDRIDEMVRFDLPSRTERRRMISQYMDLYLYHPVLGSKEIIVEGVSDILLDEFAVQTKGFSGREISKLAIAWQAAAYGTAEARIDRELLLQVLEESKASKAQKFHWMNKEDADKLVSN